jgi:hypothetical protein
MNDRHDGTTSHMSRVVAICVLCGAILAVGGLAGRAMLRSVHRSDMMTTLGLQAGGRSAGELVPAPPESALLFAQPNGGGTAYRYSSGVAIADVVAYYRVAMARLGWRERRDLSRATSERYQGEIMFFTTGDGRRCLISVSESALERATMVTVMVDPATVAGGKK